MRFLKKYKLTLLLLVSGTVFFYSNIHHIRHRFCIEEECYTKVFRSDGWGYYQYLPAWFMHKDLKERQPWVVIKTDGTKFNKYNWGPAYLMAPAYFAGNLFYQGDNNDGYTNTHGFFVLLFAMIYCFIGLVLIFRMLYPRFGLVPAFLITLSVYYATNLMYYTLHEAAMSHVYSFFLIMVFVYVTPKFYRNPTWLNFLLLAVTLSVITLTRVNNGVVVFYLFLYGITKRSELLPRLRFWLGQWPRLLAGFAILFLIWLPQFVYWHLVLGKWLVYAYGQAPQGPERFLYLTSPKIGAVLFGKVSGMVTYAPVLALALVGMIMALRKKLPDGWGILATFIPVLYLIASWWTWSLDCGFGHRGFTDFYGMLAVPMALVLDHLWQYRNYITRFLILFSFVVLVYLGIRLTMMYVTYPCWNGPDWTWKHYGYVMKRAISGGGYTGDYRNFN